MSASADAEPVRALWARGEALLMGRR
jgi:hypothetical protein